MTEEEKAYKYKIPLVENNGVESPAYQTGNSGKVLFNGFSANHYIEVTTEPSPHLHKESINTSVEKVKASNYGYDPDKSNGGEE